MADLDDLLLRTSRTFALSIPRLPSPLREEVGIAYLLFRVADTLEDAESWGRERRLRELSTFRQLLAGQGDPLAAAARWRASAPSNHGGYLDLLEAFPRLLEAANALEPAARSIVFHHAGRTAEGMERFLAQASPEGRLQLESAEALGAYCYVVAGIVGELLTDLFLLREPLSAVEGTLRRAAISFGEGLQLVNILKDASDDAKQGRVYLPSDLPLARIFDRARTGLVEARAYVRTLQNADVSRGVVEFCALPVLLAEATLEELEAHGPGATVGRERVAAIVQRVEEAAAARRPVC